MICRPFVLGDHLKIQTIWLQFDLRLEILGDKIDKGGKQTSSGIPECHSAGGDIVSLCTGFSGIQHSTGSLQTSGRDSAFSKLGCAEIYGRD